MELELKERLPLFFQPWIFDQ